VPRFGTFMFGLRIGVLVAVSPATTCNLLKKHESVFKGVSMELIISICLMIIIIVKYIKFRKGKAEQ